MIVIIIIMVITIIIIIIVTITTTNRYFWCMCPRCKDPSELETNVAGVTCELCEEGVMLPR